MGKQNLGGVYANMDFPPYEYREYPKQVNTGPYGKFEIVHNAQEEKAILQRLQKEHDDIPPEVVPIVADPEKEILISRARELGVPINAKWSKGKLQTVLKQAEEDIDNLPPEGEELTFPSGFSDYANEQPREVIPMASVVEQEPTKEELLAQAKALGIKANGMHLWGASRLKAAIIEADKDSE